jgi:anti-sigma regulatory factor (Ser/Thr protein kinase)
VLTEQMQLCLPSRPDWIEATVDYLRQRAVLCGACQETRAGKLMVALHEALSNAIVHGNLELSSDLKEKGDNSFAQALAQRVSDPRLQDRFVDIVMDYDGSRCRWTITDQGKGFDYQAVLRRQETDDPEVLLSSGRGILLMRSFLDDVRYEAGGRRLVLTLNRPSGEEKRQAPRQALNHPLRVAPIRPDGSVDWDAAYAAVSRNLSASGVALLQQGLTSSQRVLIGIDAGGRVVYVPAEIRHCQKLTGNLVELGCRFQMPAEAAAGLPEAKPLEAVHQAIGELLDRGTSPHLPHDNRRAHPRVVFNERIEAQLISSGITVVGYSRDLSKGGIAFITTTALVPEEVVLSLPRPQGPLSVRGHVVRCNKIQEGLYDVGVRFLELV